MGKEGQDRSFNGVKYIYLDNVKSVIFPKLESSMSQRRTQITQNNSGADGNLIQFKTLKLCSPSQQWKCYMSKNNMVVLKRYKNSNMEQLGVCSIKLRHKEKVVYVDSL